MDIYIVTDGLLDMDSYFTAALFLSVDEQLKTILTKFPLKIFHKLSATIQGAGPTH